MDEWDAPLADDGEWDDALPLSPTEQHEWVDLPAPIEWVEPSDIIDIDPPPLEQLSSPCLLPSVLSYPPPPPPSPSPPPPTKKRRIYTERKAKITQQQLDIAADQAFTLMLDGNLVPSYPTCSDSKCKDIEPVFDAAGGSWICPNCAVVLAENYISHDAPRQLTDADTGETDNDNSRHYTADNTSRVLLDGGMTLTRTLLDSTCRGYKRPRMDPLDSAIKRSLETAQILLKDHNLRLFNNGEMETRTNQLITDFIHIRSGHHLTATLKSSSTSAIAVAAVLQASHEMGIGLRRDELHKVLGAERAPRSLKSFWSVRIKRDLNLAAIPREWMLVAYLNRYINLIGNMTESEKQHASTLASWVRCMLSAVQLFPRPVTTTTPNQSTIVDTSQARVIGRLLPGSNKITRLSNTNKTKLHNRYDWVIQAISHTNDIRRLETKEQDDHWCSLINTTIKPATSSVPIVKASDEWHIRRIRVSSLAACIVWLIMRLRPPRPVSPVTELDTIPKTLSRRQLRRRVAAQSVHATSATSPKLHRLTQKQISIATGVADASFARCRKALSVVWNCLMITPTST